MLSIVLHGIVCYCMELICILWYRIVLHVIALYRMVLHGIVLYLTVLHGIALYHRLLRRVGSQQDTYQFYTVCVKYLCRRKEEGGVSTGKAWEVDLFKYFHPAQFQ